MARPTEFRYQTTPAAQPGEPPASVRIERREGVYHVTVGAHEQTQTYTVRVDQVTPESIRFSVEGHDPRSRRAYVIADGSRRWVALDGIDGRGYTLTLADESADSPGSRRKASAKTGAESHTELTAAMPGQVVKVLVTSGDVVTRGQPLVVLEAMKMELRVTAPYDGQVARVLCEAGQVVERGQVLLELSGS